MSKSRKYIISISLFTLIIVTLSGLYIESCKPPEDAPEKVIAEFQPSTSFRSIAQSLEQKRVIRSGRIFSLIAGMRGTAARVKAGEYEFNNTMTSLDVLVKLEKGQVILHELTIPEGFSITDIAALLHRRRLADGERFIEKAKERAFLSSIGLHESSAEGYLFPDTYHFVKGMTEENIIKIMYSRFREIVSPLLDAKSGISGLTSSEIVILASIVEKETGSASERSLIAGVFLNRLKKGIPLQSDPTVIYGIPDFNGNLVRKDLTTRTPYNTYVIKGLPPGPISNPGLESIKAVIEPSEGEYLYFVSKNDGTHFFSRTLKEHNRAVGTYQKNRARS